MLYVQGGPIKTAHFLRYHIFAATRDIRLSLCWNVQKIQQKTTSDIF